jgi:alpha-methylacyl-CoA racemase
VPRPLSGVRVLDFTRLLPGAYATLLLADLGADVIKIEDPRGGDGMRTLRTHDDRPYFELLNRDKRSVTLNLRSPEARAIVAALAAHADVTVESFRPSTARRLGVDAATLRAAHPQLVSASITGFGQEGPLAEVAAHDINYQALAGLLRPPTMPTALVSDVGAAMEAALAILGALIERQRTGVGCSLDLSILGAARAWSLFPATADLESACYTMYETSDGRWLALGALEAKFWRGFCERLGRPDMIPRQHARGEEGARLVEEVRALMRTRTRDEWMALFAGADVCLTDVETGPGRSVPGRGGAAPALGAHTDDVLDEAGVDAAQRAVLRRSGVV